ncbi:hypothetical protein KCP76_26405 (plasmid) [Salmonella enterica subsp. enterica serovar Weltevreden]|nr:hypothetical protein KCP76_26405 [Salmonella enterica subsp. enterica serovar Weltevreden]QUI99495.1 hypothetical protein KCP74_25825 [Salmonella enterica subsp. enterica]QUJ01263.1 hypothetical protein KCP73_27150 [Salmonella enterica subsp. enterica]
MLLSVLRQGVDRSGRNAADPDGAKRKRVTTCHDCAMTPVRRNGRTVTAGLYLYPVRVKPRPSGSGVMSNRVKTETRNDSGENHDVPEDSTFTEGTSSQLPLPAVYTQAPPALLPVLLIIRLPSHCARWQCSMTTRNICWHRRCPAPTSRILPQDAAGHSLEYRRTGLTAL